MTTSEIRKNPYTKPSITELEVQYAIATSSKGDEVIMANSNWVATAAPIVHLGATPVFMDILPDSWCLDPEQMEASSIPARAMSALGSYFPMPGSRHHKRIPILSSQ